MPRSVALPRYFLLSYRRNLVYRNAWHDTTFSRSLNAGRVSGGFAYAWRRRHRATFAFFFCALYVSHRSRRRTRMALRDARVNSTFATLAATLPGAAALLRRHAAATRTGISLRRAHGRRNAQQRVTP